MDRSASGRGSSKPGAAGRGERVSKTSKGNAAVFWVLAIHNMMDGDIQILTEGMQVWDDDPMFGDDVHVVPCREEGDDLMFGPHDFTRECYCTPAVQPNVRGKNLVIHSAVVN